MRALVYFVETIFIFVIFVILVLITASEYDIVLQTILSVC